MQQYLGEQHERSYRNARIWGFLVSRSVAIGRLPYASFYRPLHPRTSEPVRLL